MDEYPKHRRSGWVLRGCALVAPWICSSGLHAGLLVLAGSAWFGQLVTLAPRVGEPQGTQLTIVSSPVPEFTTSDTIPTPSASFAPANFVDAAEPTEPIDRALWFPPTIELPTEYPVRQPQPIAPRDPPVSLASHTEPAPNEQTPAQSSKDSAKQTKSPSKDTGSGKDTGTSRGAPTAPRSPGSTQMPQGYVRTNVFGAQAEGRKFVYCFDRSGSMSNHGGAPLAASKAELIQSLADMGDTQQFQIIFYNEHPRVFDVTGQPGRLAFGTDQNKTRAQRFIGTVTADGGTQHDEALSLALQMAPDVIFFLTDADEPKLSASQLAHYNRMNRGSQIMAIEFGLGPQKDPDNFLVKLARESGGKHVYVDIATLPGAEKK